MPIFSRRDGRPPVPVDATEDDGMTPELRALIDAVNAGAPAGKAPAAGPAGPRGAGAAVAGPGQLGPEWDRGMGIVLAHVRGQLTGKVGAAEAVDMERAREAAAAAIARTPELRGLTAEQREEAADEVVADLYLLGPLEPMLADETVTEVMVNAPDDVWVERSGRLERVAAHFRDEAHVLAIGQRIAGADDRAVDMRQPMCDCVLRRRGLPADRSRVNITVPPVAEHTLIDIRKFRADIVDPESLIGLGTMDARLGQILSALVRGRMNVLIEGGTGSGKTTLLNALSWYIPRDQRIFTIEDTYELRLGDDQNVISEQAVRPNSEGAGEVTIRQLVINVLRQRPDRIVVGECRGGEAFQMLQAMSTGHDGSLTTIHANNARDALSRLQMMVQMSPDAGNMRPEDIMKIIVAAVDVVVSIRRWPDGARRIAEVAEVQGQTNGVPTLASLVRYDEASGRWLPQGERLSDTHRERLATNGVAIDDGWWRR